MPERLLDGLLSRFRPKPDEPKPAVTPETAPVSISEKHEPTPEQLERLGSLLKQARSFEESSQLAEALKLYQRYGLELTRITEGKATLHDFLKTSFDGLQSKYSTRFSEFGLTPPTLEVQDVPPDVTAEHLNAIAEIFGTGNLELSVIPTEEQLTDKYFQVMYPETKREEDTTRGLTSYNSSHFKNNADAGVVGSTDTTTETWLSAYKRSIRATVKKLQGQLILTESVHKPTLITGGKQQYTTKDGQPDPLIPIIQEVFGEDASRYNLTHDHWTTELIPKVKEKIIKLFTAKGLATPKFEVILTPAIVFNQQTTLNYPENSTTSTYEWSDDILLKQDGTDSGRRLLVGYSDIGGSGCVDDGRRERHWDDGGGRLSVVFPKS